MACEDISTDRAADLTDDELFDNLADNGFHVTLKDHVMTVVGDTARWRWFLDELTGANAKEAK